MKRRMAENTWEKSDRKKINHETNVLEMSFTPYAAGGEVTGLRHCKFPQFDPCCADRSRRCASVPFFYNVKNPPWYRCPPRCPSINKPLMRRFPSDAAGWYDKDEDYMHYSMEDLVMPVKAYWYYADSIPDDPSRPTRRVPNRCLRDKNQYLPWPPAQQGVCPAPQECEPCGPGPWGNKNLRKFFFYDCV